MPEVVFVFMSTNKVYGDAPKEIRLKELSTRWDYDDTACGSGISEIFRIDRLKCSLFVAGKVSADIMVQKYDRYFRMNHEEHCIMSVATKES